MTAKHILVVDDDQQVRTLLRRCFEQDGYMVSEATDSTSVHECVARQRIDLITLDLNLEGEDGLTIARELRSITDVPIVMITGKGDTIDTVVGLEIGADDYIAKPFHVREVLARVRSVLRRAGEKPRAEPDGGTTRSGTYNFGQWTLDPAKFELRSATGETCPLTTGELQLLELFARHPHKVLSRDQIMDLLKGHDYNPLDRSIDNQVARLRKKIETDPQAPRLIKTVRGIGYSFIADVVRN